MSRARARAGVPLDLIKPKGPLKTPPRPVKKDIPKKQQQNNNNSGWHTAGLARTVAIDTVSSSTTTETKDPMPILTARQELRQLDRQENELIENSKIFFRRTRPLDLAEPPPDLDFALQDRDAVKKSSEEELFRQKIREMQLRKPAGLAERLVKVPTQVEQPENPHLIKVALLGAANAGKSTLVNALVGEEISVVSPKAHTTRERMMSILTENNHQVIFLDTPGVVPNNHHARQNRTLVSSSWRSLDEAEYVIFLVDAEWVARSGIQKADRLILDRLQLLNIPTMLVFNKMDKLGYDPSQLQEIAKTYREECPSIKNILYVSAAEKSGLDLVKDDLFAHSKLRPWLYPAGQKSDMPDLKRVEELIRVEFYKRLHQYLPYMLRQENVGWTELENGVLRIDQNVYVERDSQQKIVKGANGMIINRVVEDAQKSISKALMRPVKLFIQVKTKKR